MPFSLLSLVFLAVPAFAAPSDAGFSAYARQYRQPEFFDGNKSAFEARLKLLDSAPAGSRARIATFVFENGQATRQLARHVCLAASRGVKVELMIDSKSAGRPGLADTFDNSDDAQVVEELLQYMANCGADVFIHNQLESYVEVLGFRVPNFFNDPALDRKSLGIGKIFKVLKRVNFLMERASAIVEEEFWRAGIAADPRPLLKNIRSLALTLLPLMGEGAAPAEPPSLRRTFDKIMNDEIWDKVSAKELAAILPEIEKRFKADPDFGPFGEIFRRFNRLNHRKLFLVENSAGTEGCMVLGGRNLGDHYLVDSEDSFIDGDLLVCRHQGEAVSESLDAAVQSFENLKSDSSDDFLRSETDNKIIHLKANLKFVFRNLLFPSRIAPRGLQTDRYTGKLKKDKRTLVAQKQWKRGDEAVHGSLALSESSGWRLLLSGWERSQDTIRAALLEKIRAEKKQIFIETAYAEFDAELREALEGALSRGVKVQLITNSFFTSDGGSKLIRLLMFTWTEKMKARYPRELDVRYTAFSGGHMTHLKAAAFACQNGDLRSYILGSHNFHPRSGIADKEHALLWDEPSDCESPLSSVSFVKARHDYYNSLARSSRKRILDVYPDFLKELTIAGRLYRPGKESTKQLALAFREMFYEERNVDEWVFRNGARVKRIFRLIDESGLHDLMGRIL